MHSVPAARHSRIEEAAHLVLEETLLSLFAWAAPPRAPLGCHSDAAQLNYNVRRA